MGRTYSTRDLIQFPTMNAHTLVAFGQRLLAQYRLHKKALRDTKVARRALALERELRGLNAALVAQQARSKGDREAQTLDPIVDATWASLVMFLESWSRLDWRPEAKIAEAILTAVFPDRLRFTQEKYVQQWSEASTRIQQIFGRNDEDPRKPTIAEQLEELGAGPRLDEITEKHARFARALGLSEGAGVPTAVDVRGPYDAVLAAAKDYVGAVMQLDEDDIADVERVRHDLLSVIDEFEATARTPAAVGDAKPEPAPEPAPKG
jgi:hypothetical protein